MLISDFKGVRSSKLPVYWINPARVLNPCRVVKTDV
jgi:hypothetical protein